MSDQPASGERCGGQRDEFRDKWTAAVGREADEQIRAEAAEAKLQALTTLADKLQEEAKDPVNIAYGTDGLRRRIASKIEQIVKGESDG